MNLKGNKPCPFCGSKKTALYGSGVYYICCENCACEGPISASPEEAWENWNKRDLEQEHEKLEKEADWLANKIADYLQDCPYEICKHKHCGKTAAQCWREAARQVVENK